MQISEHILFSMLSTVKAPLLIFTPSEVVVVKHANRILLDFDIILDFRHSLTGILMCPMNIFNKNLIIRMLSTKWVPRELISSYSPYYNAIKTKTKLIELDWM